MELSIDDAFGRSDALVQVLLRSEAGPIAQGTMSTDVIRQAKDTKKATSVRMDMQDGHGRPIGSMRLKFKEHVPEPVAHQKVEE